LAPSAIHVAYKRYYPMIRAKCRRMLRDEAAAEDVAQETFLRFWRATELHNAGAKPISAWLYKTSSRLAIDLIRRRKTVPLTQEPGSGMDPIRRHHAALDLDRIARDTPDDELMAVLLNRVDGLTQVEVAEVMQQSERSVRRLLARFDASHGRRS